jgi:hypothetical protein
MESFSTVRTN